MLRTRLLPAVTMMIRARHAPPAGSRIFVSGDLPELGDSKESGAVELPAAGQGVWEVVKTVPALATNFSYRFFFKEQSGAVTWEKPREPRETDRPGRAADDRRDVRRLAGRWEGKRLQPGDCVISADAKPLGLGPRAAPPHRSAGPQPWPARRARVRAQGAPTYLDAWDVRRGRIMGRSAPKGGIAAFHRLVWQVMIKEPYRLRAARVLDRRQRLRSPRAEEHDRLQGRWPNLILVHTPVHGSWLNQVEIYHSSAQPKVLDPNDFQDTATLARALHDCEHHYNQIAKPFTWNFTRAKLAALIERLINRATRRRYRAPPDRDGAYGAQHQGGRSNATWDVAPPLGRHDTTARLV